MFVRILVVATLFLFSNYAFAQKLKIQQGMVINASATFAANYYYLPAIDKPVVTIQGENIVVDFDGAVLDGNTEQVSPDRYNGLAILIKDSKNVTIKNLNARSYRVAVMAENVEGLVIENSDLSYNYRQRLYSMREREDLSDWLSYHQNEKDEWLRYGAAVYLKDCNKAQIHDVRITQGQNGIMLMRCNDGLFYNNDIRFNSGIGIGLYRSSRNKVMHNRLDWNVRGYSHGFYSRGQDSAAILCYEQSNNNVFAYNSATHSGDGFFLWAGQSTMDTGEGGCNNNMLYANDFSHSPTNGVEVTFSSNQIIGNRLDECTYGVWGGYSYKTLIAGNRITNCQHGIAIEHGQNNTIANNYFANNQTGVWLWQRKEQPADWGYAQNRDVMSRDYNLWRNAFVSVKTPLKIAGTRKVIINDNNEFYHFQQLLQEEQPNENRFLVKNNVYVPEQLTSTFPDREKNRLIQEATITDTTLFEQVLQLPDWVKQKIPAPLPDGIDASLSKDHPRGRRYMLVNEWGPYNFEYPAIWLRELKDDLFTFDIMGPQGEWRIIKYEGLEKTSESSGSMPATISLRRKAGSHLAVLQMEFKGKTFVDQWGYFHQSGNPYLFSFQYFDQPFNWQVKWVAYDESSDPLTNFEAFAALRKQIPLHVQSTPQLAWRWWGAPHEKVPADKFATFATAAVSVPAGKYRLTTTSDDGLKLYVDGNLLIDHWDIHEPAVDEVVIDLHAGEHLFEIYHFDAGGLATIDFRMTPIP